MLTREGASFRVTTGARESGTRDARAFLSYERSVWDKVTKKQECYSRGWWQLKGSMNKKKSASRSTRTYSGKYRGVYGEKSATYPVELHGHLNILRGIIELGGDIHLQLGEAMSLEAS